MSISGFARNNTLSTKSRTTQDDNIIEGRCFSVPIVTQTSGVSNYPVIQLWNPVNSGKKILIVVCSGWTNSGTNVWQIVPASTKLASGYPNLSGSVVNKTSLIKNVLIGSSITPKLQLTTAELSAVVAASNPVAPLFSNTSVASPGVNTLASVKYAIMPGYGVDIQQITAPAKTLNLYFAVCEIDL